MPSKPASIVQPYGDSGRVLSAVGPPKSNGVESRLSVSVAGDAMPTGFASSLPDLPGSDASLTPVVSAVASVSPGAMTKPTPTVPASAADPLAGPPPAPGPPPAKTESS